MKWMVYAVTALLFSTAEAQQINERPCYTGTVISSPGNIALPAAVIHVINTKEQFLCDSFGRFRFYKQPGRYLIRISHTGYADQLKEIILPGEGNIQLLPARQMLEAVVVTAVAGATRIKRTPVSIAIVTQKEMTRTTSSNVIDAVLKAVPGISAITTGPNISKPLIRGLGYTRVLTLYDGLRQEGQQWGDEHGVEIDQYGIARAEIVKGPASLMYGSDAIAGVVNLIPGLPASKDQKIHGDAITEYQSNNGMYGLTASIGAHPENSLWSIRASHKSAANYRNRIDGRVYNTGFSETNLSALIGWEKPGRKNYLQANLYDNFQEIPDGSRDSLSRQFSYQVQEADRDDISNRPIVPASDLFSYAISPLHQHIQHYRIYQKGTYPIGNGELSTLFGFQQNRRREYNHPTLPSQAGLDVQLNTWNYELKYNFQEWQGLKFTYGINGMLQQNINRDATDFPIPDYNLFDIGSYLLVKKDLRKLVLTGGVRADSRHVHWNNFYTQTDPATGFIKKANSMGNTGSLAFPAYDRQFSGVSGSLGMVYNFSDLLTVKANLARGYRCPSIPEIGSDGLDPGARIYYIGNRQFNPEFNWQSDLGLFLNYPDAELSLEFFDNRISNYIFLQKLYGPNGQPLETVPGNFTYAYRQGSAHLYGAEASWLIHPTQIRWLHFQQSLAWVNGLNTDAELLKTEGEDAKYLPLIPPFKTNSRLKFSAGNTKKDADDYFLQLELETSATQHHFYAVDNTETATAGYVLLNLGAGISFRNRKDVAFCSLSLSVNNVFDAAYQSHQNRLKYFEYYRQSPNGSAGIYNMGRNIAVKAVFNW
ncbi:MAG: TonB-dependent receptor [Chitinophagaceae bacterium]|nr:TonB-dependent receptor [Chitinophagaceae bacterium]